MDPQTQTILLAVVGGMVLAGVVAYLWISLRAVRSAARRKFIPQRPQGERSYNCDCPPHQRDRCVPARVSVPDHTPVAIYGVRTGDSCCGSDHLALREDQVQAFVDRANRLHAQRRDRELDQLLSQLGSQPGDSGSRP